MYYDYAAFEWKYYDLQYVRFCKEQRAAGNAGVALWATWCGMSGKDQDAYEQPERVAEARSDPDTEAPLFDLLSDDLIFEVLRHLGSCSLSKSCCASRALWDVERAHADELWKAALERRSTDTQYLDGQTQNLDVPNEWDYLYRGALDPGGVRARQGWSFKKRLIDVVETMRFSGERLRQSDKQAEDLNDAFDFFIQISSRGPSRKFHTFKVEARQRRQGGVANGDLEFALCEQTTFGFAPHGYELHALRRADGAMARLFYDAWSSEDVEIDNVISDVNPTARVWFVIHDIAIDCIPNPREERSPSEFCAVAYVRLPEDSHTLEPGWDVVHIDEVGDPGSTSATLGPLAVDWDMTLEPGAFCLSRLRWLTRDHEAIVADVDPTALYHALHGTRHEQHPRWT